MGRSANIVSRSRYFLQINLSRKRQFLRAEALAFASHYTYQREFDVVSDKYIGQAKPGLRSLGQSERNQAKATFEAAKQTEREVYYEFESQPSQQVIEKLREYEQRYKVKLNIDIKK